jgi:NitT/TauT family transport system substrate-binding protein
VRKLLAGHVEATTFVNEQTAEAQEAVNDGMAKITGKSLKPEVITAAWKNLSFTDDPVATSLVKGAAAAAGLGLIDKVDLKGIFDVSLLNAVLRTQNLPAVSGL